MKQPPAYQDSALVTRETARLLALGHSIFQIFQYSLDETSHVKRVLSLFSLNPDSHILSLGCGVGGFEAKIQTQHPAVTITLVNLSQEQLDLCVCPGERICSDLETFQTEKRFDLIILAYVLGHVNAKSAVENAVSLLAPGGKLLITDISAQDPEFEKTFSYKAPELLTILSALPSCFKTTLAVPPRIKPNWFPPTFDAKPFLLIATNPT